MTGKNMLAKWQQAAELRAMRDNNENGFEATD